MFGKPSKYYDISTDNGILKVSMTKEAMTYFVLMVMGFWLINLATIAAYGVISAPLTKYQWGAMLFFGTVGTVAAVILFYLLWGAKTCAFDRGRDRFSRGKKLLAKLHEIRQIFLYQEVGQDKKLRYVLSLALEGKDPCCLYSQDKPDELQLLANTIAAYLGVSINSANPTGLCSEELRTRFEKHEKRTIGWFLFFAILSGLGWMIGLSALGSWEASRFTEAAYLILPTTIIWVIPAVFLGILTGSFLVDSISRRSLKADYAGYVRYQERKHGWTTKMAWYLLYGPITMLSLIFIIMALDWYIVFTPVEIVIDPFLGFTEGHHQYSSIVSLKTAPEFVAPNGQRTHRREYLILFSDGSHWSTNLEPSGMNEGKKREIMDYVSLHSRVPIQRVEVLTNDEVY